MTVGNKIKSLRETQQISIEELAVNSGLTQTEIERMETTDTIPSLAPLIKVARALGVRLGTFLDDNTNLGPVIIRREEQHERSFASQHTKTDSHLDFYTLAGKKAGRHMEPFFIDVEKSDKKESILSSHEGEEFLYVLKGAITIQYGKHTYELKEGDSIYYDSIVNHLVSAPTEAAKILAVIYTPM